MTTENSGGNLPIFIHSMIDDMTDITPNAMRVYMHLSRRANKSRMAWPSYQSIGDHCFSSVSANPVTRRSMARKAIDELLTAGLISKENRQGESGHTSNAYLLADAVSIGIAMPQSADPMPIDTAMPNGTKDTLIEDTPLEEIPEEDAGASAPAKPKDHVAVKAYRDLFERFPTKAQMKIIAERDPPIGNWVRAIRAWAGCNYNPRNIEGMLDWAFDPQRITDRPYRSGGNHANHSGNTGANYQQPAVANFTTAERIAYDAKRRAELPF